MTDHLYSQALEVPKNVVNKKPSKLKNHTPLSSVKLVTSHQVLTQNNRSIPIGLWITLNNGWHSYWQNPGESGKPLKIKWTLPKGSTISDFKWPLPERVQLSLLTHFVYKDDFLLISELSLPKKKPGNKISITAQVEWLICKEVCIPLQQKIHLILPVEPLNTNKKVIYSHWQSVFNEWSEKIPKTIKKEIPLKEKSNHWLINITTAKNLKLLDVFPLSKDLFSLEPPKISSTNQTKNTTLETLPNTNQDSQQEILNQTGPSRKKRLHSFLIKKAQPFSHTKSSASPAPFSDPPHSLNKKTKAVLVFSQTHSAEEANYLKTPPAGKKEPIDTFHRQNIQTKKVGLLYTFTRKQKSLFWFLLLAFLGGVILNLMPCVLPIVFLKFSNTLEQAKQKPLTVILGNLFYSAGVISSFLILAFLLILFKKGGESIGWGFQMQSPYFLVSIIFLFTFISFGFMGWFTFSLPSLPFFHRGQSHFKHFLTGVLSTTSASPCTAPFMGAAIGYAFSNSTVQVIMIFLFLGLGLSFPYLLLSVFPKWMKYVPSPGNWSHKLKHFMAFPMLATSAWLIHLFNKQEPSALLSLLFSLLFLTFGFWLLNNFKRRTWLIWLSRVVILTSLIYPFFHLDKANNSSGPEIKWEKFSLKKMQEISATGQPLFINFTADWCLTCKFNERFTFKNKKVVQFFIQNQIQSLKGDWTNKNQEITEILNYYNRSGIPFYLYLPPGAKPSSAVVLPELLTPGLLLKYLKNNTPSLSP